MTLTTTGDDAELTLSDDGRGIPVERRAEVFRPFARLDTARDRAHGGVGLGLAIVADAVRSHGGTVEILTAASGPAEFRVRLPLAGHPTIPTASTTAGAWRQRRG